MRKTVPQPVLERLRDALQQLQFLFLFQLFSGLSPLAPFLTCPGLDGIIPWDAVLGRGSLSVFGMVSILAGYDDQAVVVRLCHALLAPTAAKAFPVLQNKMGSVNSPRKVVTEDQQ